MILTNYHKLATIVESLAIAIRDKDEHSEEKEDHKLKYLKEEIDKKQIINELETINQTIHKEEQSISRKTSEDLNLKLNSSLDCILSCHDYSKHISNYCTVYLDFDAHSEEYKSYIVNNPYSGI